MEKCYIFLARLIPEAVREAVLHNMIDTMDDASISLQEKLIRGLERNLGHPVRILNYLPVCSYPQRYKKAFVKTTHFSHCRNADDINLGFCNVIGIKRTVQYSSLRREIADICRHYKKDELIFFAYTPYPEFMRALKQAKNRHRNIKTCVIVPDLPQYVCLSTDKGGRLYNRYNAILFEKYKKYADLYVVLTKYMPEAMQIGKIPSLVMEGICSEDFPLESGSDVSEDKHFTVFYGGTLHRAFGIGLLMDAVKEVEDPNFRLKICGLGDMQDDIKKYTENDGRIQYLGQLSREEVLRHMLESDVIVNPRQNTNEFTKYSFPSKNLEGLSSGIPFAGFKLPGIPDEYDEFINYPRESSARGMAELLTDMKINYTRYLKKAETAREYVIKNKNEVVQTQRILEYLDRI